MYKGGRKRFNVQEFMVITIVHNYCLLSLTASINGDIHSIFLYNAETGYFQGQCGLETTQQSGVT